MKTQADYYKTYYYKNREKILKKNLEWQRKNKEKVCERVKKYYKKNKEARQEYYKELNVAHPEIARNRRYKRKYGITIEEYNAMFEAQEGHCANKACNKHQSEQKTSFSVDHCHATGAVRGLLCKDCNFALGNAKDNVEILLGLIDYLKTSSELLV
jgi:hypothetical protein